MPLPPPLHGAAVVGEQIYRSQRINAEFDCRYINNSLSRSIAEVGCGGLRKKVNLLLIYARVLFELVRFRPALCCLSITVGGNGLLKDFPVVLLCKIFFRKIVIYQHNRGVGDYKNRLLYKIIYRIIYHRVKVILLSQRLYPEIADFISEKQVLVCPNGVEEIKTLPKERPASSTPGTLKVLYLSHMQEQKGCLELLRACRILHDAKCDFFCTFAGEASKSVSAEAFREKIKSDCLTKHVSYLGPQYGADKARLFEDADVFILPTQKECFGLVLVEAAQYHLPVIATAEGGIPDIIADGGNGFLLQNPTAKSISEILLKMASMPRFDLAEMGERNYAVYKERYTFEQYETRLIETLKKCL